MAKLTKAQARSLVREFIDDSAAKLWSDANLDIVIQGTLDILWGELMDFAPWLRSTQTAALAPTTPGLLTVSSVTTRLHRFQDISRNNQSYRQANPKDVNMEGSTVVSAPDNTWIQMGDVLYLFPLSTTQDVYIRYSSWPTEFGTLLSGDSVEWPDGYHLAYVYDAAARAMEKGDREKSDTFRQRAADELARLRAFLRKRGVGPVMPYMDRDSMEWGSIT